MIRNKKKNNVFKLCSLFVMVLLCIVSFVVPTKAYYQDDNGNLKSSNLLDPILINTNSLSITDYYTIQKYGLSNNTTYTLSFQNLTSDLFYYRVNWSSDSYTSWVRSDSSLTFNTSSYEQFSIVADRIYNSSLYNLMLNVGSSAMSYEPYGTYYSQTNYDNNGIIQHGQGYREGKNDVYDSLQYQNISRLVNNVALAKYDTANETFINRPNINSVTYESNDLVVAWSTNSSDNDYWYHLVLSWSTNSIIKDVGFTPSRFSNVILDINGYQTSNVNYNGSYFGFFGINEQYNTPCNTLTLMFKINRADIFENVHINIQGFNENIQIASEQYNEGYEQGVNVGKAEGYSTGYSEGVNQATQKVIGWKGLFFSMADLPFKTVSNFLGFEVLGVNLFKAFIGFITVLGILWVFKRLVK